MQWPPPRAAPPPVMDAKAAVESILAMFTLNQASLFGDTGKPLPANGAWGAQTQFPAGMPKVCMQNRVPCVKVVYRVAEDKVSCEWTLGLLVAAEPQPDGTVRHAVHQIVLDENDAAARYTLRKGWGRGEAPPRPTTFQRADYPAVARDARVGGVVTVRLIIGPDGLVKSAVPLGGPAMLQKPVLEAVSHWKYDPLMIGQHPTSFQIDHQFSYDPGKSDTFAGMDPSGRVMLQQNDSHLEPGFHSDGASSGSWGELRGYDMHAGCAVRPQIVAGLSLNRKRA